jgi:drug/metabolite transporter (DMT)-like permease
MNIHPRRDTFANSLPYIYPLATSVLPIMVRFLAPHFDNLILVFIPFLTGSACLLALAALWEPAGLRALWGNRRVMASIVLTAAIGFLMNMLWVEGLRRTSAVFSGLMSLAGVPLTMAFAALFYADERAGVRSLRFWIGFSVAITATLALALSRGSVAIADPAGALYLLGATVCNVTIGLLAKKFVMTGSPICLTATTCGIETLIFLAAALAWGDFSGLIRAPLTMSALLAFYGVYGLLLTGAVYWVMIKRAGVVIALFVHQLVTPVFTAVFAYLLLGETLSPLQLMLGVILLAGAALILSQRRLSRPVEPAQAAPSGTTLDVKPVSRLSDL